MKPHVQRLHTGALAAAFARGGRGVGLVLAFLGLFFFWGPRGEEREEEEEVSAALAAANVMVSDARGERGGGRLGMGRRTWQEASHSFNAPFLSLRPVLPPSPYSPWISTLGLACANGRPTDIHPGFRRKVSESSFSTGECLPSATANRPAPRVLEKWLR